MSTDPIYCRRLRPLMPMAFTSCSTNNSAFSTIPTRFCSLHNPKTPSWNQPLSAGGDSGGKREIGRGVPLVSSRWNPTPEQLQALEEIYRRGTRTPSAEQIQQITAKLRKFGKIEGKNVFYWFQNHKARDRQKKRRQLELLAAKDHARDYEIPQGRQSGLSRRHLEIEHPKKLPTMSSSSTSSKYSGAVVEECKRDGWRKLDSKEFQQQAITAKSTEICCLPLDFSYCMPPNNSTHKITYHKAAGQENANSCVALNQLCKLMIPQNDYLRNFESGIKEDGTLPLFPIRSNDLSALSLTKEESYDVSSIGTKVVPNQYFEFLPTKK